VPPNHLNLLKIYDFLLASTSTHCHSDFTEFLHATAGSCNSLFDMENGAASEGRDPSSFLQEIIGAPVTVKLNSGVVYKGEDYLALKLIAIAKPSSPDRRITIRRWIHEYCP